MKIGVSIFFLISCSFLFLSTNTAAQSTADDSLLYKKSVYQAIGLYHQAVGDQATLYNGSQYGSYPFRFEEGGFQFFSSITPGSGSITYDDVFYEKVLLQYDEIQEVVIMQDSTRRIQLLNPRISDFTLFGHNFIRIIKDSATRPLIKTGFYEILYKSDITLLKREEKTIREEITRESVLRFIDVKTRYYIVKDNTYYSINNKNSITDIFSDRKKDLRQYIRKNKLSYKHDRDNMLIKTTAYYDQLNKTK